jgi:DNA-binding transcriptional LysR family regulator
MGVPVRLREIEVFHAVMQSGSMSAASRLLNVSQSAISQVLGHAETQLGFRLFERAKGKLIPTVEGRLLFNEAQKAIDALETVRSLAENLRGARSDHVRIAATDALSLGALPNALVPLRRLFPDLQVTLRVLRRKDLIRELLTKDIDLGFMFEPPVHPAITTEPLATTRFVLAAHRTDTRFTRQAGPVKLERLAEMKLIRLPSDLPPGILLVNALRERNLELQSSIDAHTSYLAIAMVQAGEGIAVIDGLTAVSFPRRDVRLMETTPSIQIRIAALWAHMQERSALMDIICRCVAESCRALQTEPPG